LTHFYMTLYEAPPSRKCNVLLN